MTTTPVEIARRALADHLAALPPAELLGRYATRRDPEAFAGLVQQFGPMVLGVCRRVLGPAADVDDAFQAVFLALARQAGSFRDAQALPAWLHRVALRVSHKALARRAPGGASPETVPDPSDPFADVAWKDVRRVLDEELDALPDKYRGPVVLCWLDGLTQDEAAGKLGTSLATLKRRLDAGRELLRARLVRRGLAPVLAVAAVASPTGLRATVPEALKVLAVELGVGAAVPSGVAGLEVLVSAAGPSRRAALATLLGAGTVAAGGLAYAWNRSRRPPEGSADPPPEPRRVTAPRARLPLNDPKLELSRVSWTPNGKRISTWQDGTVHLWDGMTGKEIVGPRQRGGVLHPGGSLLATADRPGSIDVREFATGKTIVTLTLPKGTRQQGVVWSPDGKRLAALLLEREGVFRLWGGEVATQKSREIPIGSYGAAQLMSCSPNGQFLAVFVMADPGKDLGAVHFWDITTGSKMAAEDPMWDGNFQERFRWWGEDSATYWVKYDGVGPLKSFRLATGEVKKEESLVWGVDEQILEKREREGHTIDKHTPHEWLMDWSEDGQIIARGKQDETKRVLQIENWRARRIHAIADWDTVVPPQQMTDGRQKCRLSRDGTTLMTYRDGDVLLWDVSPLK